MDSRGVRGAPRTHRRSGGSTAQWRLGGKWEGDTPVEVSGHLQMNRRDTGRVDGQDGGGDQRLGVWVCRTGSSLTSRVQVQREGTRTPDYLSPDLCLRPHPPLPTQVVRPLLYVLTTPGHKWSSPLRPYPTPLHKWPSPLPPHPTRTQVVLYPRPQHPHPRHKWPFQGYTLDGRTGKIGPTEVTGHCPLSSSSICSCSPFPRKKGDSPFRPVPPLPSSGVLVLPVSPRVTWTILVAPRNWETRRFSS